MVVSGHGVEILGKGEIRQVTHGTGPRGVFLFRPSAGIRLARGTRTPSVYDIAPTVLAPLGSPLPLHLVWRELFLTRVFCPSWERARACA